MITKPTFLRFTGILVVFVVIIQMIIILYNHFSGYLELKNLNDFIIRWTFGSALSVFILPFFTRPDIFIVSKLNKHFPWSSRWRIRVLIEMLAAIIIAIVASTTITLLSNYISPYQHGLNSVIVSNILIGSVINLIIIIFLEAWNWYWAKEQSEKEKNSLESELKLLRFELLKQQINPHFMFNSLNVLSGLIKKNAELAEEFLEAFADVYRYVMETIEKPSVTLHEELQFAKSYFFLQQIRHGNNIDWTVDLSAEFMSYSLPPLSLQLLIENAIKHNSFSSLTPLLITIRISEEGKLIVSNNIQKKSRITRSSGTGLENLKKRYTYLTDDVPGFFVSDHHYIAKLPLIKIDK